MVDDSFVWQLGHFPGLRVSPSQSYFADPVRLHVDEKEFCGVAPIGGDHAIQNVIEGEVLETAAVGLGGQSFRLQKMLDEILQPFDWLIDFLYSVMGEAVADPPWRPATPKARLAL